VNVVFVDTILKRNALRMNVNAVAISILDLDQSLKRINILLYG